MNSKNTYRALDVLIVEDELDICYLLSGILRRRNLNTFYVRSLSEAEKELNESKPTILFIDNHLPDGFGIDFISGVKVAHPEIKIIMITAYDTRDDEDKAITRGADFFIGKPFTSKIIIDTVDTLLKAV